MQWMSTKFVRHSVFVIVKISSSLNCYYDLYIKVIIIIILIFIIIIININFIIILLLLLWLLLLLIDRSWRVIVVSVIQTYYFYCYMLIRTWIISSIYHDHQNVFLLTLSTKPRSVYPKMLTLNYNYIEL